MSLYRIQKTRSPVTVTLMGGDRLSGDMFVQEVAASHSGYECPLDVLNSADAFFPLALAGGETWLVAKDVVLGVETTTPPQTDPQRQAVARLQQIEVRLTGGTVWAGAVDVDLPDSGRLLDLLNRNGERFLTLIGDDCARFVNRRLIERVRPLS